MKLINIYFFKDKIFVTPTSVLNNGPKIMTGPIFDTIIDIDEIKQGIEISLQNCGYINEEPAENYFNAFLKISKAKTNKNLVENGKLVSVAEDTECYYLKFMTSNLKYKSFEGNERIKFEKSEIKKMIEEIINYFKPTV